MTGRLECRGCKRAMKHPTPSGYGPVCAQRRGLTPPKQRRPRTTPVRQLSLATVLDQPPPEVIPGQTEIPLSFHQPTLESI